MREKLLLVIISLVLFSFPAIGCEQKKETYTYMEKNLAKKLLKEL